MLKAQAGAHNLRTVQNVQNFTIPWGPKKTVPYAAYFNVRNQECTYKTTPTIPNNTKYCVKPYRNEPYHRRSHQTIPQETNCTIHHNFQQPLSAQAVQ